MAELDPLLASARRWSPGSRRSRTLFSAGELPAELALAPAFTDPLFWDLVELDPDVIVPGLGEFPLNRVRLLAVNAGFVGAYLVGANHQLARSSCGGSTRPTSPPPSSRASSTTPTRTRSTSSRSRAGPGSSISDNLPNAAATTVILIRGDLVRRYPEVNVFLAPTRRDRADYTRPSSRASRAGSGPTCSSSASRPHRRGAGETGGPEYFVMLEERVIAPRFGLDVERDGALTTWDESR